MAKPGFPFGPHALPILEKRYLAKDALGRVIETPFEMLGRVALGVAKAEALWACSTQVAFWEKKFYEALCEGLFLPNSPTLMNAQRPLQGLSACFVLPVQDSLESIFEAVKNTAIIHKTGGGTGFNFSNLRPAGDSVKSTNGISSGPVSFMQVFDSATEAIKQGGVRRGANMGILDVDHPDIKLFIKAKTQLDLFNNFNLSVMVTNEFMEKAANNDNWSLINPRTKETVGKVKAKAIFDLMVKSAYFSGEPGIAFYDAINKANPTPKLGRIQATNPCGEQPLLPYESCNLASLVLPRFVKNGCVDWSFLEETASLATRFLDDALQVNRFPIEPIKQATLKTRKIGLGVMGFADLLIDLSIPYESKEAEKLAYEIMERISLSAKQTSRDLAEKRGNFPAFGESVHKTKGEKRMRNATVTTVAPTGSLSLLMGTSPGIEPNFALIHSRQLLDGKKIIQVNERFLKHLAKLRLDSSANLKALANTGRASSIKGLSCSDAKLYATAHEISSQGHLAIQAAFQANTDNAVSKTVNLAENAKQEQVAQVFQQAYDLGLKGVTVFRQGCRGRGVLELLPLPGQEKADGDLWEKGMCKRCGGMLATDGGCQICLFCGASGCE